jgi:predicted nucleic acid-binding protein
VKLPKKIIDANIILRFLLADEEKQFLKAKAFIQKLEYGEDEALLTEIVFAEVVWVLHKVYDIPRKEISEQFSKLLYYSGIKTIISKEVFIESLRIYPAFSMDIQDIFLAVLAKAKECWVITFDKTDFRKFEVNFREP